MTADLKILSGKRQGFVFHLDEGTDVDIGNRKSAKLSIRDPWISYNHARISGEGGRFFIEDLGSSNGTWINGEKVKRQELNPNDVIYFGKTKVNFMAAEGAEIAEAKGKGQTQPIGSDPELGVSVRTLHRWHGLRCGPPRITVGHTILYNVAAVRRWLQDHEVEPMRSAGDARRRHD